MPSVHSIQLAAIDPQADADAEATANAAALAAARGEQTTEPSPTAEGVPNIPEKFKGDVSALAKAYAELEAKLSSRKPEPTEAEPTPTAPDKIPTTEDLTPKASDDPAEAAVAEAGLDFAALNAEYAEKGELSEETYEKLAAGNIPKDVVDDYIAGKVALSAQRVADVLSTVGGLEAYTAMGKWAADNYTDAEKEAFDSIINSSNVETAKLALSGLKARYEAANGKGDPAVKLVGKTAAGESAGFSSKREQVEAMKDPRYQKDPAYQAEVARRTALMVRNRGV